MEGLRYTGEQIKGACLVPKRALDVMSGEVNRVLQMANSSIIPITWQVRYSKCNGSRCDAHVEEI